MEEKNGNYLKAYLVWLALAFPNCNALGDEAEVCSFGHLGQTSRAAGREKTDRGFTGSARIIEPDPVRFSMFEQVGPVPADRRGVGVGGREGEDAKIGYIASARGRLNPL